MGHKQFRQSTIHDSINQNFQMTWVRPQESLIPLCANRGQRRLLLVLLMLTATLSGRLGGEGPTEEVYISTYTDQIDAQEATINQLLSEVSMPERIMHLLKIGSIPPGRGGQFERDLASANQNIASTSKNQIWKHNSHQLIKIMRMEQMNEQIESLIDALNASLNENILWPLRSKPSWTTFADLSEANTRSLFGVSVVKCEPNYRSTCCRMEWCNSTITSLISTYSLVNLVETLTLDYSKYCLGPQDTNEYAWTMAMVEALLLMGNYKMVKLMKANFPPNSDDGQRYQRW